MMLPIIRSIASRTFPQNNAAVMANEPAIRCPFGLGHSPWRFLNGTLMKAGSFEMETLIPGFAE